MAGVQAAPAVAAPLRLLFTTQPGHGHFFPMLPLAHAARAAGHDVAFATSPTFCRHIERAGFTCLPAGVDWLEADIGNTFPDVTTTAAMSVRQETAWWLNNVWADDLPARITRDVVGLARSWCPDVVVHEQWELGGALGAELSGLPYAMHAQGRLMSASRWKELAGAALGRLRHRVGLPPDPDLGWVHRYCYFDTIPPSLQVPHDLAVAHRYRPAVRRQPSAEDAVPSWMGDIGRRPTVYASMGTVFNQVPHVFAAILTGLADEPVDVILVVGESQDPASLEAPPENVHVERFVAQATVLPYCDVVITHAGYNTVSEALSQGLPLLTIPLRVDQPINAERCVQLGVARRLLPGEVTPEAVRHSVRALLTDPRYKAGAERIRNEIEAMPPVERAVARLEQLATVATPSPQVV